MTIHHDKLAYGKLDNLKESLSEEKLADMAKKLSSSEEEAKTDKKESDGQK